MSQEQCLSSRHKYDYLFNLLLVGESGVGKTVLLNKFVDNIFEEKHLVTIGINFKIKFIEIENIKIKLHIWDSAGVERFRTITNKYYPKVHGIMLIYDVSYKTSFNTIPNWLKSIESKAKKDCVKILVGTKCDITTYRQVSEEEGKNLAENLGIKYFETSSKTDQNVNKPFYFLAEEILKMKLEEKKSLCNLPYKLDDNKKIDSSEDKNLNENDSNLINKLKENLKEEKLYNQKLKDKIEALENELDVEKFRNYVLEEKAKKFEDELKKLENLEQNLDNNIVSKESLMKTILEKDKELNELKQKLSRYPFELKDGEKLMTVNIISNDQKVQNYSIICKNTDTFNIIEKKLYEDFKEFYETENYFTFNGKKIHKLKSLDENNINNNDVIILNVIDI